MRRVFNPLVLASVLILIALPAAAADNGFYIGASVGQAAIDTGALGDIQIDENSSSYKAFAGVRFLNFLAVEGGYRDLGSVEDPSNTAEFSMDGYDVQGMVMLPLGVGDIFAKAGMMQWDTEFALNVNGISQTTSQDGEDPVYGVGIQFRFMSFAIRGEVEYIDVSDVDQLYMYSIGGTYTF